MSTVFVSLLSAVVFGNFINPGGVIELLAQKKPKSSRLIFLISKSLASKIDSYKSKDIIIEVMDPELPRSFLKRAFQFFYSYLIFTGTTRILATFGARADLPLAAGNRYLAFLKAAISGSFGKISFIKRSLVPWIFLKIFKKNQFTDLFVKYNPDLVFAPNIALFPDLELLAEAKNRGLKTIGMACNWDHLNKYFIPIRADYFLVQNELMKKEAVELQSCDPDKIVAVGFPQFDAYLDYLASPTFSGEFRKEFGIPQNDRIILFISGSAYSLDEPEILKKICEWIEAGEFGEATLMIRPYVITRDKEREEAKYREFVGRPRVVFNWVRRDKNQETRRRYLSMLYHADVVIPIFSTMAIEAAIFKKPTVTIGFDGSQTRPPHQSIRRLETMSHFKHVLDTGSVKIARSFPELRSSIKEYLANPEKDRESRYALVSNMCYKLDGKSSERIVDFLFEKLK